MPEFIDPVFTKTSPKRSFSLNRKRAFWLVFVKTGSIISGTVIIGIPALTGFTSVEASLVLLLASLMLLILFLRPHYSIGVLAVVGVPASTGLSVVVGVLPVPCVPSDGVIPAVVDFLLLLASNRPCCR